MMVSLYSPFLLRLSPSILEVVVPSTLVGIVVLVTGVIGTGLQSLFTLHRSIRLSDIFPNTSFMIWRCSSGTSLVETLLIRNAHSIIGSHRSSVLRVR